LHALLAALEAVVTPAACLRDWTDLARSAATGRECGGRKPEGADNRRQPVIGMHKDRGPSDGVTYTGRGTGNHSPCGGCNGWGIVKQPGGFAVVGCGQCHLAGATP
jgi:hypothetical protein